MVESFVKLHGRPSFQPITTADNQATLTVTAGYESLRPAAAAYLPGRKIESQITSASLRTDDPFNARTGSHDSEKGSFERHLHPTHNVSHTHSRVTDTDLEDDGDDDGPKEHAIWILIYLSALSPLLAIPFAIYTLLLCMLLLLLFPLCFCLKQSPICARFRYMLSPLLRFQLRLVYSSYDIGDTVHSETIGIMVLVFVCMFSPLHAISLAVVTWVAGIFWFYTAILGNPDGKEDRDDGREAILAVRGWWERWLLQGLEPNGHSSLRDS